ncbi:IclR family transcriptional regulator [Rhodococcus rhodochrous]|uniref:IclR family transcriptional regulator n=1 Tax=Rhodococcus rhodochrous TaxID=1829 RepID=UPI001E28F947|nr:IclR family transcriptional regulator [Rhodococcus rhodochrous]MCB8910781.1 IclR family transcriptional regulator [Rhodococcus rhodochrous]
MTQVIVRAAEIIERIAEQPMSVAELAAEFDVHRSSMFRQLKSLEHIGYVRRRADARFVVGAKLISLARLSFDEIDLRQAGYQHVRRLHESVGHTIQLVALIGDSLIYVDKVERASGVGMYSRIGREAPAYCSGVGKVILAALDPYRRDTILNSTPWKRFTPNTFTTREQLDEALTLAAERGWAVDDRELDMMINCLAVPIYSSSGVVGAVSVTAVSSIEDIDALMKYLPLLQDTARAIGRELG